MTGHTKEPWAVSFLGDIQGPDCADGDDFVAIQVRGSTRQSQYGVPRRAEKQANLHRAVDCVNALVGIPDPAAFVRAARGMADLVDWLCEYRDHALQEHWDDLSQSLEAFRATMGEVA